MNKNVMFILLLLIGVTESCFAANLLSEGFETSCPPIGWAGSGFSQSYASGHGGMFAAKCTGSDANYLTTPLLSTPYSIIFWGKKTGNLSTITISYSSTQNGTFTTISSVNLTNTYGQYSVNLESLSNVYVKLTNGGSGLQDRFIDDVLVSNRADITDPSLYLLSFTATLVNPQQITLDWTTLFETGMLGFTIVRSQSANLQDAVTISDIISATNTSQPQSYQFDDTDLPAQPQGGYIYYWLRVVKINGDTVTFPPVSVYIVPTDNNDDTCVPTTDFLIAYPNPFCYSVKMHLNSNISGSICIYNLKGQLVKHWQQVNSEIKELTWDGFDDTGKSMASGIYLLRFCFGTQSQTLKLLKLK